MWTRGPDFSTPLTVKGLRSSLKSLAGCLALLGRLAAGGLCVGNPGKPTTHFKTARVGVPLRVPVMAAFLGDMRTGVDTPTTQGGKAKPRVRTGQRVTCSGALGQSWEALMERLSLSSEASVAEKTRKRSPSRTHLRCRRCLLSTPDCCLHAPTSSSGRKGKKRKEKKHGALIG